MAGVPPKPPPPTFAAGSSSSKPQPPTFNSHRHPSYAELMDSYLRPRVVSGTKVGFIHDHDLYSADPYLLTGDRLPATSRSGETAWYFFTPLLSKGPANFQMKRTVDAGREGAWVGNGNPFDVLSNGRRIGRRRSFAFDEKVGRKSVRTPWRMIELRLEPNGGGQEQGSSNLLALCKVYRIPDAKAGDESSMAAAKADAEAPAAPAVVTPGPKRADEEIAAETAAGPGRKRKAGDKDSGAEMVASSPGSQKTTDGESADAATTGEIFADSKDPLDAAEKAQQEEPRVPRDTRFYNFLGGSDSGAEMVASSPGRQKTTDGESADAATTGDIFADDKDPLHAAEKAEQEQPRDPRDPRVYNFFDGSSAPLDPPEEAEQEEPRDPRDRPFIDFFRDSQNPKKG